MYFAYKIFVCLGPIFEILFNISLNPKGKSSNRTIFQSCKRYVNLESFDLYFKYWTLTFKISKLQRSSFDFVYDAALKIVIFVLII